jgi:hypothetical protein
LKGQARILVTKQILLPLPDQVLWKFCAFSTFGPFRNLLVHGGGKPDAM